MFIFGRFRVRNAVGIAMDWLRNLQPFIHPPDKYHDKYHDRYHNKYHDNHLHYAVFQFHSDSLQLVHDIYYLLCKRKTTVWSSSCVYFYKKHPVVLFLPQVTTSFCTVPAVCFTARAVVYLSSVDGNIAPSCLKFLTYGLCEGRDLERYAIPLAHSFIYNRFHSSLKLKIFLVFRSKYKVFVLHCKFWPW